MSKGGSNVTVSTYYADIHFVACYGPIDKITKIYVDKRLAYEGNVTDETITIDKPDLFGGETREGGIVGDVDVMLGGPSQVANTYLSNKLGEIPAYRKVVSLILKNMLLGQNYYLKPWTIVAERIHTLENGAPQWYDAYSEINTEYLVNYSHITQVGTTATVHVYKGHGITTGSTITVSGATPSQYNQTFNPETVTEKTFTYIVSPAPGVDPSGDIKITNQITGLINGVHVIRECLTNPTWGYGYSEALLPETEWQEAALTCYNEKLGFGFFRKATTTLDKFIDEVLEHINATLYSDRTDGKIYIQLIRKVDDPSSLLELTKDHIVSISSVNRKMVEDLASSYTVRYTDNLTGENNSVTVRDLSLYNRQTIPVHKSKSYSGIVDLATAYRIALRDHASLKTPLFSFTITCDRTAEVLNKGDAFQVTYPDYFEKTLTMRVLSINLGTVTDGKISIECIEDSFEAGNILYELYPYSTWVTSLNSPIPATTRLLIEAPYYSIAVQEGDTYAQNVDTAVTFIGVAAGKPTLDSISAGIWTTTSSNYTRRGVVDFCFTANTAAPLDKVTTVFTLTSIANSNLLSEGSYIAVNNELMGVVSLVDTTLTVIRGVLDTPPQEHSADSTIYGVQDNSSSDGIEYIISETVYVKLTPITPEGELIVADAPADNITTMGRMHLPYPPGNFKINTLYWPASISLADLNLTWAHRNRFQQTAGLSSYYTGSVTTEPGVTYSGTLIRTDTSAVLLSFTGETGTSVTMDTFVTLPGSVVSITRSGLLATVTMSSAHGLTTGRFVKISGATDPLYNGDFTITVTSTTTFTYVMSGTPADDASGSLTAEASIYAGEVQLTLKSTNANGDCLYPVTHTFNLS